MATATVKIDDESIKRITEQLALLLSGSNCMGLEKARHVLFRGKGKNWVKYYILSKPEVWDVNGGWCTKPSGRGKAIIITDVIKAREWLSSHTIDWNAPDPMTLKNRLK